MSPLTLRPHEVEVGDQFLGLRSVVDRIVFDGADQAWLYFDHLGNVITTRRIWQTAQVLRGARRLSLVGRTPDVDLVDATVGERA